MLFPNGLQQIRCRSMLRQTEVKAFREVLQTPKVYVHSYALFYKERFPHIKSQNPNLQVIEVAKKIAAEWNTLSEAQKTSFKNKVSAEKEKYVKAISEYKSKLTPGHKLLGTLLKYNRKDIYNPELQKQIKSSLHAFRANFPEGPYTPRGLYLKEKLAGKKIEDKATAPALAAWQALSPSEKAQYEAKAKNQFETYKSQISSFLTNSANYKI